MIDTWQDNQLLVKQINNLWRQSEEFRIMWENKRQEVASSVEQLLNIMTESVRKVYGDARLRLEPVIEKGEMSGLKVWINDNCQLFKTPMETLQKQVVPEETNAGTTA